MRQINPYKTRSLIYYFMRRKLAQAEKIIFLDLKKMAQTDLKTF
jgi:hypothetical protein